MAPTPFAAAACCRRRYCHRRRHPRRLRLCSCKPSSGASAARWKAIECSSPRLAREMRRTPGGWSSRAATWASQRRGCARPSCSTGARRSSAVNVPAWQCRARLVRLLGRAWRLRAARDTQSERPGYWAPSHGLRRSSQPVAKVADSTALDPSGAAASGPGPCRLVCAARRAALGELRQSWSQRDGRCQVASPAGWLTCRAVPAQPEPGISAAVHPNRLRGSSAQS